MKYQTFFKTDTKECSLCLDRMRAGYLVPCGHKIICKIFLNKNIEKCPYCNQDIKSYLEKISKAS